MQFNIDDFMPGRDTLTVKQPAMNRKQRRAFVTLFRRKKLRLLPLAHFSAHTKQFLSTAFPKNW